MPDANQNLPENYIQEILETYADGVEKHKEDSKSLLADLLKKSDTLGKRINSLEDYKALQGTVADIEANGSLSSLQKLGLKELKNFITTEYPQYGQEWLTKKHTQEKDNLSDKQKKEKNIFDGLFDSSNKTIDIKGNLQASYIDDLLQNNPKLDPKSVDQLNTIKDLITKNPNNPIHPGRLSIKNNLVCIDGYTLPTGVTPQHYKKMQANPENFTYPGYAKELLTFAADITRTAFTFPSTRDHLQKREINGESFKEEINTPDNQSIIRALYSIVGFDSVIPVGLDKNGYTIYAVVRSGYCFFDRYNGNFGCLVSTA